MIKDSEKARQILWLVRNYNNEAMTRYYRDDSEYAATIAANNVWREHNPDDGVGSFGSNPYNVSNAADRAKGSKNHFENTKEVLQFAEETFLKMIDK